MTPLENMLAGAPVRRRRSRRRRGRVRPQREPRGLAREYAKALRSSVAVLRVLVGSELEPRLPAMLSRARAQRADGLEVRLDDLSEEVDSIIASIRAKWDTLSESALLSVVDGVAGRVSGWQAREFRRQSRAVRGIDVFWREPWLKGHLDLFVADNVKLIKSIPTQALDQVENTVHRALRRGTHVEELTREIGQRFGATEQRARLIARDQTLKLHGELNRERQKAAGVTSYTWRISGSPTGDERVRKDHRELEGTVHEWGDPPIVDQRTGRTADPGEDFQCRCTAEPIFEDEEA